MQSGIDVFVTSKISEYLVESGLADIKKVWSVIKESQYDEICRITPPKMVHEISIARTVYDSDFSLGNGSIITTKPILDELKERCKGLRARKCTPLSYKHESVLDPIKSDPLSKLGSWKDTKLHWQAAKRYPLELTRKLDSQDRFGFTALHEAISSDNREAVTQLLDAGASISKVTKHGFTPIDLILKLDRAELLQLFARRGLVEPAGPFFTILFKEKSQHCIDVFLNQLEDVDFRETDEQPTYLMQAISWRNEELVSTLLNMGANPNAKREGMHQDTVLGLAISSWNRKLVELVLQYGADPNQSILRRKLHYPIMSALMVDSDPGIVSLLLAYGADLNIKTDGKPLLDQIRTSLVRSGLSKIAKKKHEMVLNIAEG